MIHPNLAQLITLLEVLPNFQIAYQKWNPSGLPIGSSVQGQLQQVSNLSQNYGLSAAELVKHLERVEALKLRIQSQWEEFSSPAKSTSKLLIFLPVVTHLFALSIGIQATLWVVTNPFGIALLGFASLLTWVSIRLQKRDPFKVPRNIAITSKQAMMLVFITCCVWQPTIPGVVFASLLTLLMGETWDALLKQSRLEKIRERKFQNTWELGIVISALDTGMSWSVALALIENTLSGKDKVEIQEIRRRIEQGATPEDAFQGSDLWSEIGVSLSFAQSEGARITPVLRTLRDGLINEYQNRQEIRTRKQSQILTVAVSALQLPAFIAIGLVPIVAEPIMEIIHQFSSTVQIP